MTNTIKTPSQLKAALAEKRPDSHFFDYQTMRHFGDTVRNFGLAKTTIISEFSRDGSFHPEGVQREVFKLYRKRPVNDGLMSSHYFDCDTLQIVFPK